MNENSEELKHIPVFAKEILDLLIPESGPCKVIDCTLGYGGHSSLILKKNRQAELLGIDRDGDALSSARKILEFASDRIHLVQGSYSGLKDYANGIGWISADVILLDAGISSPQIDNPQRGFSFRLDGPLDMRMDKRSAETASRFLNTASFEELERVFREYGEVRKSRKMADAVLRRRAVKPLSGTLEFAALCEEALGKSRPGTLPSPTLCFQAVRIAVNRELEELENAVKDGLELLEPEGKMAVISFHSLEDRIVKNLFRDASSDCLCPPGLPVCVCGHKASIELHTRKPMIPDDEEIRNNSRASSAKLRIAIKKAVVKK